jgi:hypothetical protein
MQSEPHLKLVDEPGRRSERRVAQRVMSVDQQALLSRAISQNHTVQRREAGVGEANGATGLSSRDCTDLRPTCRTVRSRLRSGRFVTWP